jgi:hypothetical protein
VGKALRYRLARDLHLVATSGGSPYVQTHRRWDAVDATAPRSIYILLVDGVERQRFTLKTADDLAAAARRLAGLDADIKAGRRRELTDAEARADIKGRTGIEHAEYCSREDCSGGFPIGSDRCTEWHSAGQSGGGTISGLGRGRRGPIFLPARRSES